MQTEVIYLVVGLALFLAVLLPALLARTWLSAPMVLLGLGIVIGLTPITDGAFLLYQHRALTQHLTEFCVLVALMGVGLALDRPLSFKSLKSWRAWSVTWRLLGITMPLCIGAVAVLGWGLMGLLPASALLLGAALAPTDPVLASEVQVEGPSSEAEAESEEHIDEEDEVRFALTSEAGLNDGLAFPFVYGAIFLASKGSPMSWWPHWLAWELVGKVLLGVAGGLAVGWLVGRVAFRSNRLLKVAERGEPLLGLAVLLVAYGAIEMAGGYAFISVFTAAMTLRSMERGHHYHKIMHALMEQLERLLTLVALLLIGISLSSGLLKALTWQGIVVAIALVLVIRPLAGVLALIPFGRREQSAGHRVTAPQRMAIGFFGVRGIGSLYYLAYATGKTDFPGQEALWACVGFTIVVSAVVHGVAAGPIMKRVEGRGKPAEDDDHEAVGVSSGSS